MSADGSSELELVVLTCFVSYKQNKFNLLREQSEGYSKLAADLVGSLGPPHDPSTGLPSEGLTALLARAQGAWERVVSVIGYFDLDPNRTLDVVLDIFSVNIASHWQFFLALLAHSPWCGQATNIADWDVEDGDMKLDPACLNRKGKSLLQILSETDEHAHGSAPSKRGGDGRTSHVLAQVLGFKFSHYQVHNYILSKSSDLNVITVAGSSRSLPEKPFSYGCPADT